jgi:hypothetical protein
MGFHKWGFKIDRSMKGPIYNVVKGLIMLCHSMTLLIHMEYASATAPTVVSYT